MFTIATIVFIASLLVWALGDLVYHDTTGIFATYFHVLFLGSIMLYAIAIVMKIGGKIFKPFMKNKCIRCGATIPEGRIYCSTHEREITDETREKLEETWKRKKGQP